MDVQELQFFNAEKSLVAENSVFFLLTVFSSQVLFLHIFWLILAHVKDK